MNSLFEMLDTETTEQPKKKVADKKTETKKEAKVKEKSFTAPFLIYLAAEKREFSHIFEAGKSYTEKEITKAMLEHGYYDFAGSVTYDFKESDNVLVPVFQQHKKG